MTDFEMNDLWNTAGKQASQHYEGVEPKVLALAKQQSNSILHRLQRKIWIEWGLSGAILTLLRLAFFERPNFLLGISIMLVALGLGWIPYRSMLRKIAATPTHNIADSLRSYIAILDAFVKRLKALSWVVILGIAVGHGTMSSEGPFPLDWLNWPISGLLAMGLILVLMVVGIMAANNAYLERLYGKPRQRFKTLLESLETAQ